jgi:hypothetical protein
MATSTEKTAAFLRQFLVKQASLITLDSFLTKVASALPMAKRAAFRVLQTKLSAGNSLAHSIKVAFPRLSGEQRGVFAATLCKSAADVEKKTKTFESYAVPVKEGNKMLREKCSKLDPALANALGLGGAGLLAGGALGAVTPKKKESSRLGHMLSTALAGGVGGAAVGGLGTEAMRAYPAVKTMGDSIGSTAGLLADYYRNASRGQQMGTVNRMLPSLYDNPLANTANKVVDKVNNVVANGL